MIIYRVEDKNGCGPYRGEDYLDESKWRVTSHWDEKHPVPSQDGIRLHLHLDKNRKYHCGFKSLRQLFRWFIIEEIQGLKKLGFKIVAIEIDEKYIKFGKHQIMFDSSKVILSRIMQYGN